MTDMLQRTRHTICLADVWQDFTILDRQETQPGGDGRVLIYEDFAPTRDIPNRVKFIDPNRFSSVAWVPFLRHVLLASWLLHCTRPDDVLLVNGGATTGKLVGLFNQLAPIRRRKVVMWDLFCEARSPLRHRFIRWMAQGCDFVVVFSRRQVHTYAQYLRLPNKKFIFLPYKANHSKSPPIEMPIGNYVFAGGNSRRDYRTLFTAVSGTGIPVIVSATDPDATAGTEVPSNVILLSAKEPAFARLMAGSRFAVVPLEGNCIRGAGEASVCNAMWHGKPVIVVDDVSAFEHIEDEETGYVVAPGDVETLRERIVSLWNDSEKVRVMGKNAHRYVESRLTHDHFVHRLLRLAILVSREPHR